MRPRLVEGLEASDDVVGDVREAVESMEGMDAGDRVSMLVGLQKNSFNLIRHADGKAQMLLRIALALAGAAFIGVPPTVISLKEWLFTGGPLAITMFCGVIALYLVCTMCLLIAVMKIMRVIRPRMSPMGVKPSVFFHQTIVGMGYEEFREEMRTIEPTQAIDELTSDLYQMAHITSAKYRSLNEAIGWMMGGGLFGLFFAIILMVSFGLAPTIGN